MRTLLLLLMTSLAVAITLKMGVYNAYPLVFEENGTAKGIAVDVIEEVAHREGWKITYVFESVEVLIDMLEKGDVDIMLLPFTQRYSGKFSFSDEAIALEWGVIVGRKSARGFSDLSGKRIALVRGNAFSSEFLKIASSTSLEFYPVWVESYRRGVNLVRNKVADFAILGKLAAVSLSKDLRISPIILSPVEYRFAFSRLSPFGANILKMIDDDLRRMKEDPSSIYWKSVEKFTGKMRMGTSLPFYWLILISSSFAIVMVFIIARYRKTRENLKVSIEQVKSLEEQVRGLYNEMRDSFERFQEVMELVASISTLEVNEEEFLKKSLQLALKLVPKAKYGSISFIKGDRWIFAATVGHDLEKLRKLDLKREYAMVDIDRATVIDDILEKDVKVMPDDVLRGLREATLPIKSTLLAPLRIGGELVGFFSLDIPADSDERFSDHDAKLVDRFARIISSFYAIRRYQMLEGKLHKEVALALVRTLEYHDPYTKGHSEKVAELSAALAQRIGLSRDRIRKVYWAGLVHDIGKIFVPKEILLKKGKLTEEEFEVVKKHPVIAYEILSASELLSDIALMVLHHHERCDGNGYPRGLTCDQIPLESRILAIADAFDAMTSERSYRPPLSIERAIVELLSGASTQFDAFLVEEFINMIRENPNLVSG